MAESGSIFTVRISHSSGTSVLSQEAKLLVTMPSSISEHLGGRVLPSPSKIFAADNTGAVYALFETYSPARTIIVRKYASDGTIVPLTAAATELSINANGPYCEKSASANREETGGIYVVVPYARGAFVNKCDLVGGAIYKLGNEDTQFKLIAQSTTGNLFSPLSVFSSPSGKTYFVDMYGPQLRELGSDGKVSTVFKLHSYSSDSTMFIFAGNFPKIVAMSDGLFYGTGSGSNNYASVIYAYDTQGRATPVAGRTKDDGTTGVQDGIGNQANFFYIASLMRQTNGSLIVHDGSTAFGPNLLRHIALPSAAATSFAGSAGASNTIQTGPLPGVLGAATEATLGADGAIYVMQPVNEGYKIYKVAP